MTKLGKLKPKQQVHIFLFAHCLQILEAILHSSNILHSFCVENIFLSTKCCSRVNLYIEKAKKATDGYLLLNAELI